YEGRLKYVPIVSRESSLGKLQGRIPELIASGELANKVDVPFSPQSSFVMLCCNPEMIKDTLPVLQELWLEKYRTRTGGHFIYERYW
ncbi:ferredoxin--NADP(+) reductase, partial [Escherichia coli]|nr:ferredoxin--NADP(+) reductase [Escherichia coli]